MEDRNAKVSHREHDNALDPVSVAALARTAVEAHEIIADSQRAVIAGLQKEIQRHTLAIEHISEGVSYFSADHRLILCNARYAEIYGLDVKDIRPGMSLREVVEMRVAAGTSPEETDRYLALCADIIAGNAPNNWSATLADGRRIEMRHHTLPDGSWISTHEDITEAAGRSPTNALRCRPWSTGCPTTLGQGRARAASSSPIRQTARRMGRVGGGTHRQSRTSS